MPEPAPTDATITDLAALGESILGPTDDVVGELSVFITVPPGIATPTSATITEASVGIYPNELDPYFSATVVFESESPNSDLVTFFETTLTAAGYIQVGDTVNVSDTATSTTLRFANPFSELAWADVEVDVLDYTDVPDVTRLEFTGVATPSQLLPLVGWTEGMPLPAGGEPVDGWVSVSTLFFPSVDVSLDVEYAAMTPDEVEQAFEAGLPAGGFAVATGDVVADTTGVTDMSSTSLYRASVSYYERGDEGAAAAISGGIEIDP